MSSMNTTLFKDKKRVSIFLTGEQEKELKKKAIDVNLSLSEFLVRAGTGTFINQPKYEQTTPKAKENIKPLITKKDMTFEL